MVFRISLHWFKSYLSHLQSMRPWVFTWSLYILVLLTMKCRVCECVCVCVCVTLKETECEWKVSGQVKKKVGAGWWPYQLVHPWSYFGQKSLRSWKIVRSKLKASVLFLSSVYGIHFKSLTTHLFSIRRARIGWYLRGWTLELNSSV